MNQKRKECFKKKNKRQQHKKKNNKRKDLKSFLLLLIHPIFPQNRIKTHIMILSIVKICSIFFRKKIKKHSKKKICFHSLVVQLFRVAS